MLRRLAPLIRILEAPGLNFDRRISGYPN